MSQWISENSIRETDPSIGIKIQQWNVKPMVRLENKILTFLCCFCWLGPFDEFHSVFDEFSSSNFTTFFSEEWRESSFHNLKNGFRRSPTDFYLRPFWLSLYDSLSYPNTSMNSNPKPCYLNKLLHKVSIDWLDEFLRFHHSADEFSPTFGIMKINEMSHDYLERSFWIDEDLLQFFRKLFDEKILQKTFLFFASDHGHRQHRLRLTRIGTFESKLPFFSVLPPANFDFFLKENLEKNRKSFCFASRFVFAAKNEILWICLVLTSWWDVHETLLELVEISRRKTNEVFLEARKNSMRPGTSLLRRISNRNCSTAGIPGCVRCFC